MRSFWIDSSSSTSRIVVSSAIVHRVGRAPPEPESTHPGTTIASRVLPRTAPPPLARDRPDPAAPPPAPSHDRPPDLGPYLPGRLDRGRRPAARRRVQRRPARAAARSRALEPSFDQATALSLAVELARDYPDRTSRTQPARRGPPSWMIERFGDVGLTAQRDPFDGGHRAGLGADRARERRGRRARDHRPRRSSSSPIETTRGRRPGANDNASGTGALLELARNIDVAAARQHTVVFLSTDGGAFGGAGAAQFAEHPEILRRFVGGAASIVAVVNLDAIAGGDPPPPLRRRLAPFARADARRDGRRSDRARGRTAARSVPSAVRPARRPRASRSRCTSRARSSRAAFPPSR